MIGIVVQARMGSARFPEKMMARLKGMPMIEWVIQRVKRSQNADAIILATSSEDRDDVLVNKAKELGVHYHRGSETDVLHRIASAASKYDLETIVRVCADNPLVCPHEVDRLIHTYQKSDTDYMFNAIPAMGNGYPNGLGAEITSSQILKTLDDYVTDEAEREHVFMHIWNNPDKFTISTFKAPPKIAFPDIRLDVDTKEDLDNLEAINLHVFDTGDVIIRKVLNERKL